MKLTWFGGTTLRIHIGGKILVCGEAPADIDAAELTSGADRVFRLDGDFPAVDPTAWVPRRAAALVNEAAVPDVLVHRADDGAVLVDAVGEPPLLLVTEVMPGAGRWSRDAVVVAFSAEAATSALGAAAPRMIALALPDSAAGSAFERLAPSLGGTGLVALEPRMALEV
jgi:hypothetical protein